VCEKEGGGREGNVESSSQSSLDASKATIVTTNPCVACVISARERERERMQQ
jgi:hypothetical protein